MAEFCTCGSIKIGGNCTNKNCINRETSRSASSRTTGKSSSRSASAAEKGQPKSTKTRKSSKVVTYNLYDIEREENVE